MSGASEGTSHKSTVIHNIRLVDSYSDVPKPLLALPAIFGVDDTAKGDFPQMFIINKPKFQFYHGSSLEWYDPDNKFPKKRQELNKWYS